MRTHAFIRNLLLLLALASPSLLLAQFQSPNPDELKMTADPMAPGAVAVYLNVEEITDDPHHFQSFYARIKILGEKGKELATVEIPYLRGSFKVSAIEARTIHSDGTVIPLTGKPEDLLLSKTPGSQIDQVVFNLPSVEVGSILEYRYFIHYDDDRFSSPRWEIQRPYFVHKAHYAFSPFKAFVPGVDNQTSKILVNSKGQSLDTLLWWQQLPPGISVKTNVSGTFSVDLAEIPPTPQEDWMPPIRSLLYRVFFYYQSAFSAADFWDGQEGRWSKDVDHFAEPSIPIKAAAQGLVAPSDSDLEKAKKLYTAVQALENTDFSRKKGEAEFKLLGLKRAKRAEDTWSQKSGSSDDIALLYLSMLRAAGLTGYAMRVVDRDQGIFSRGYLNFDQLDDDLVILSTGGKEIFLDPGEKMCPFQTLHWRHSGASGIRQSANGHAFAGIPLQVYTANTLARIGDVTINRNGVSSGNFRFVMNGQQALHWRQTALRNDPEEVKKLFDQELTNQVPEGVEAHIDHFLGLDDPDLNLIAVVHATGTLGSATSKRLLLPGFFFETRGNYSFVDQEKRLEPVDMHYGDQITDQVIYHLPPGLALEGAPQVTKIPWAGHASFVTTTAPAPSQIAITRQLSRAFTFAKPEEYQDLRDFFRKVAHADEQQLVLIASRAGESN